MSFCYKVLVYLGKKKKDSLDNIMKKVYVGEENGICAVSFHYFVDILFNKLATNFMSLLYDIPRYLSNFLSI